MDHSIHGSGQAVAYEIEARSLIVISVGPLMLWSRQCMSKTWKRNQGCRSNSSLSEEVSSFHFSLLCAR
jgi:hypothetical protein